MKVVILDDNRLRYNHCAPARAWLGAAPAAGSSRGGHGARESSSGCGAQQRDGTGLSLGGKGLEKQIAPALGWEQIAGQGEEEEEGFGGRETVLFENLLKNAIQEAILNTYVCLNATATFPLIYYESPK